MSIVNAHLIGRFGNAMHQYAFARKYAEQRGLELRTNPWPGQQIFEGVNKGPLTDEGERLPENYRQTQDDLIYTRADVRRWFNFKQEWIDRFDASQFGPENVAHRRIGDYASCGYVVVSQASYVRCAEKIRLIGGLAFITEESPTFIHGMPFPFLADFMRMVNAAILLRGNSSFSWWAATLSNARVFSPVIDGLEGGKEQDCEFLEGNWPRLSNLECCTDLHLRES